MKHRQNLIVRLLETELIIVLAIVLLLGILFGYSLAKGTISPKPDTAIMDQSFSSDGLR